MNTTMRMRRALQLWLALFVPALLIVFAADYQAGMQAFQKGDFASALKEWRLLAEGGDTKVQVLIGHMYYGGQGVPKDDKEAVKWYRRAAEQGNADGEINLGSMYNHGQGVTQDLKEAARWYRMAADQGSAAAQFNLGIMYREGQGLAPDVVQAYFWSGLAAAQGRPGAKEDKQQVARKMTPAQITAAETMIRNFKPKRPVVNAPK